MPQSYRAQVATAFEVLAEGLAPFIDARMTAAYPDEDWVLMAATKLGKRRDVLVSLADPHFQLEVINRWWGPAFGKDLSEDLRQTVTDLRTARNHWAHPDEDHPFDFDYALKVHQDADELLRAVRAPQVEQIALLIDELRWADVRDQASEKGLTETEALMEQFTRLQKQYDELQAQLDDAHDAAASASGHERAVARQLAELQSQYAAVSGLRDEYRSLQRQLREERTKREAVLEDTSGVREQLQHAETMLESLLRESTSLQEELAATRRSVAEIDPLQTEAGRRWLWLVATLLTLLALVIAITSFAVV